MADNPEQRSAGSALRERCARTFFRTALKNATPPALWSQRTARLIDTARIGWLANFQALAQQPRGTQPLDTTPDRSGPTPAPAWRTQATDPAGSAGKLGDGRRL
jgi:hypothetical protein